MSNLMEILGQSIAYKEMKRLRQNEEIEAIPKRRTEKLEPVYGYQDITDKGTKTLLEHRYFLFSVILTVQHSGLQSYC